MESFKPPRKSAVQSYLKNPLVYLGLALVVLAVSISILYKQDKSNLAQRVQFLKGNVQIASTKGLPPVADSAVQVPPAEVARQVASTDAAGSAAAPAPTQPQTSATALAEEIQQQNQAVAALTGASLRVYYAEVPRAALERLYEESQATGHFNSFGDYTAGALPDMATRLLSPALRIHVLDKEEKPMAKVQQWFRGIHDPDTNEDLGLGLSVEVLKAENGVVGGEVEIIRSWKDTLEGASLGLQKDSFPAAFELPPGVGFFIAGVLPHRSRTGRDEELAAKGPFQILKSQSFQNSGSEFVIFIEFDKKP